MKKLHTYRVTWNAAYKRIVRVVSSRQFLWLIVILFALQALWVALSFKFPMVYDEDYHYHVTKIFSHQISPIITNQPTAYDTYGDLMNGGSTLYHYLLSYPERLVALFTASVTKQVILLRFVNIGLATAGLYLYAKLLRKIGIAQKFVNLTLLLFTLLPITSLVAATINYDNLLFLLTPWYLLIGIRLLNNRKLIWQDIIQLVIIGCFAALVKFTFLPIFAVSVLYIGLVLWRRHGKQAYQELRRSILKASRPLLALYLIGLVFFVGLFSTVYVRNTVQYGNPAPSCEQSMGRDRCSANVLVRRTLRAKATVDERPVGPLSSYTVSWFSNMTGFGVTGNNTISGGLQGRQSPWPLLNTIVFGVVIGFGLLLYAWRSLKKNASWYFLLTISVVLIVSVYIVNVKGHYAVHTSFANQPRYLLSVMPILLGMILVSANFVLRKSRPLKMMVLIVSLLLFTQGGGVTTHIIESNDTWYWQTAPVIKANNTARHILDPIIVQEPNKYGL